MSQIFGNTLEALIGAVYLDKGYAFTRKIILKRIIDVHFDMEKLESEDMNYKSQMIEWSQREKIPVEFKVVDEIGNGYGKQYVVELMVDGTMYGEGRDYSIKGAEQQASGKAIERLETESRL